MSATAPPSAPAPPPSSSRVRAVLVLWAITIAFAALAVVLIRRYQADLIHRIEFVDAPVQRKADILIAQADRRLARLRDGARDPAGGRAALNDAEMAEAREVVDLLRAAESLLEQRPASLYDRFATVYAYMGDGPAQAIAQGESHLAAGDWEAALQAVTDAGAFAARLLKARALLAGARVDESAALADALLDEKPDSPEAHFLQASVAQVRGDLQGSMASYERGLRLDDDNVAMMIEFSAICEVAGDLARAESALRMAAQRQPRNPVLHHRLGLVLMRENKAREAVVSLERASDILPNHLEVLLALREAYVASGDAVSAERCLLRAMAISPAETNRLLGAASP